MEKEVEIKIKLEDYVSKEIPTYAHEGDACVDLKYMGDRYRYARKYNYTTYRKIIC